MQRRGAVQQHRMVLDDLFQDVPDLGALLLDQLLGTLDGLDVALLLQHADDEGLEELEGHALGQAALVQLQLGTDHDDRTARVVDALAEQVLPEAALLALDHVAERLQRPVALALDRARAAAVVEQGIDGLLQHALLVAQDDARRLDLDQLLQPVVPVDDAAIQVVEVRRRETAAIQGHQGPQVGRQHRDAVQDHPLGLVLALDEGVDDLQPLEHRLLALHRRLGLDLGAQLAAQLVEVGSGQQLADRLGPRLHGAVPVGVLFLELPPFLVAQHVADLQLGVARIDDDAGLVVEDPLEVLHLHGQQLADAAGQALEEPDVRDGHGQLDVAEAFATDLALGDLDAALVADHAAEADALVLAAVALPVLDRAEDPLAEKAVLLRLEGAVVDGFRLLDFTVGPGAHLFRRRQPDGDGVEFFFLGDLLE